jgi:hypothetical protein
VIASRTPLLVLCIVGVLVGIVTACEQTTDPAAPRTSRRGEACRITADCGEGLACVPVPGGAGGFCVTGDFHVRPTAKDCAIVECSQASDCCDQAEAQGCAALRESCIGKDAGEGSPDCIAYRQKCGCDNGTIDCEVGNCVSRCSVDKDCAVSGRGRRCSGGKCVQCTTDPDCGGGKQCVNGGCQTACTNDGDCAGFDRCLAGRCIASGCQADRECVASTRNVDARCGTDGKCIVPCETDLECGNPTDYRFFSCIEKECIYVGCESDKDCRLFLFGPSDASVLLPNQHAVCRDRGVIGDVTKPAQ